MIFTIIPAENSFQMLQSQHNRSLRDIDDKFEEFKTSFPSRILSMKIKDVMKLTDVNDIIIDEKMSNLNVTVKESAQKADEGKFAMLLLKFHTFLFPSHFLHHLIFYLIILFLPIKTNSYLKTFTYHNISSKRLQK